MKTISLVRTALLLSIFTISGLPLFAQKAIKGALVSGSVHAAKTKLPVEFAAVALYRDNDSVTAVVSSVTNKAGDFALPGITSGNYILKVSFVGFKTINRPLPVLSDKAVATGIIELQDGILLDVVKLEGDVMPVKVSGDTTAFSTAAFKAAPDATLEDGLKKIPTIEIDKDGNIKSNGDDITKITVDGKPFFGNDPKIATKNLPYDAISKVKIIEEKSEKAKATGIDDGIRVKTMDVTLKDDKKKGWFGSASGAGGTEDRYLGSASINRFSPDKQYNLLVLTNNVNQVGFSSDEASNFGSAGSTSYSVSSNGSLISQTINGVSVGNASQGLTSTNSGGFNYGAGWGKKYKSRLSTNYFGTGSSTLVVTDRNVQQTQPDAIYYTKSNSNNSSRSQSHRINTQLSGQIDSLTSFNMTPNLTLGLNNSISLGTSAQTKSTAATNASSSRSENKSFRPTLNGNMSINRSLHNKKGRMSVYIYGNYNPSDNERYVQSENNFYNVRPTVFINRLENNNGRNAYLDASFNFNRQVSSVSKDGKGINFSWSLSPTYYLSVNNSDTEILEYDPSTALYSSRLDSLSNNSTSVTTQLGSGAGISLGKGKWSFSLNNTLTNMNIKGGITGNKLDEQVNKNYLSSAPNASFSYRFKPSRSLSISSSMNNSAPSVSNLTIKQNNSNPLYIRVGNPDLKMSSSLYASVRYSSSNVTSVAAKRTSSNISFSYNRSFNSSASYSFVDTVTGITTSKPINISGNYSMSANGSMSLPTFFKELRLAPGFNMRSSKNIGFYNGVRNTSLSTTAGGNLTINYANKETLTVYLSNRTSFTNVRNTSRAGNHYFSTDNSANINVQPIKKWRLVGDFTHRYTGVKGFVLLNAGIQRYVMANNKILLELRGFDLLNKNTDVVRSQYDTQISDMRSNNLGQYFYMKLTYKVNKIGGTTRRVPAPPSILYR